MIAALFIVVHVGCCCRVSRLVVIILAQQVVVFVVVAPVVIVALCILIIVVTFRDYKMSMRGVLGCVLHGHDAVVVVNLVVVKFVCVCVYNQ